MKHIFIFMLACGLTACQSQQHKQQSASGSDAQIMDMDVRTMSDSAKFLLIDISNSAWFQAQVAEVGLLKMHDTSMLSLAQNISKQYTGIKDKAKIVSVPYKLNMPYFLKPAQNIRINELKGLDDASFTKQFLLQISAVNDSLIRECNHFKTMAVDDSDIVHFITFSKAIIENTQMQLQKKL